jgi:hypothetical protein
MARITLSPIITDIRGKVADAVFSKWRGINTLRARVTPGNPSTPAQQSIRAFFHAATKSWNRQSAAFKASFNEAASGQSYSGCNRYITELRAANVAYRDFATTLNGAATAGATTLDLTAVQPPSMPSFLDSTGFVVNTRIMIAGDTTVYTVTAVDDVANTVDISPALVGSPADGTAVYAVGVDAPDTSPFTPAS